MGVDRDLVDMGGDRCLVYIGGDRCLLDMGLGVRACRYGWG